jgi:hypothetical protein
VRTLVELRARALPPYDASQRLHTDHHIRHARPILLPLAAGRHQLTPLRQLHTTGGTPITATIHAATTTWTHVRYQGFPQML